MRAALLLVLVALLASAAAAPAAKRPGATAKRCAPGTYPALVKGAKRLRPRRDGRGRLRCLTTKARSRPAAPGRTTTQQLGRVADGLDTALALNPAARAGLDRRLGRHRTDALIALGTDGWRKAAGAASRRARAADTSTSTFGSAADGTAGKATISVNEAGGADLGIRASVDVEADVTKAGVEKLVKDKLPTDATRARVKVKVDFQDTPRACPSAAGEVPGRLKGRAEITLTVTGADGTSTEMRLSAEADMTYTAKVGEDGRWTRIDDVDNRTEFQSAATGTATRTYRGRRLGGGFGRDAILGSKDFSSSLNRDWGLIDPQKGGGIFGPKGGWDWKRGVSLSDLKSVENVQAMVATWVATDTLLLAGVEYLRGVALPRGEKHWYDDEACLTLKGEANPTSVRAKGVSTVTASEAKAKDGGPVPANLTATGTASIDPGAAALAAGGKADFKLTAPEKGSATWTVIAISRAGKKTVSGAVPVIDDVPAAFTGTITSTQDTFNGSIQTVHQTFASAVRYELASRSDNPDGSITAVYDLKSAPTQVTDDAIVPLCATYRFEQTGGVIAAGDLELDVAPDGTATYGFVVDVGFAGALHLPISPPLLPQCPGSTTGLVKTFLNGRTTAGQLRTAPADRHLVQATTDDVSGNVPGFVTVSAGWDLQPS